MAVTAVEQVNRLRIRFASCSFHSSTGAAQSMKFFPKKGINILNWLQNYDFQTDLTQLVLVIRSLTIDN